MILARRGIPQPIRSLQDGLSEFSGQHMIDVMRRPFLEATLQMIPVSGIPVQAYAGCCQMGTPPPPPPPSSSFSRGHTARLLPGHEKIGVHEEEGELYAFEPGRLIGTAPRVKRELATDNIRAGAPIRRALD